MNELNLYQITSDVLKAIAEDVGSGDLTSQLLPVDQTVVAQIITREPMVLCGQAWANETLRILDRHTRAEWFYQDGQAQAANSVLCHIHGNARAILSAERIMLNFLQTLSATATTTQHYVQQLAGLPVKLLDTRKTLPGLRYAQKYAVRCGGGQNHRHGLYDAFLIKENHIKACGSIAQAVAQARALAYHQIVEIEVTDLNEFKQALAAKPDVIMLDNFDISLMYEAGTLRHDSNIKLEVSGGVTLTSLREVAQTGIDYISIGAMTKNIVAIDLTLLLI